MTFFETRETRLDSATLPYHVAGEGQPLLYVHPAGGPNIGPAQEALAGSFRVYLPTLPGFDGSPAIPGVDSMQRLALLLGEFIATEIGQACDVIGHSFGGWLATWLAVLHPDRVQQLVLAAPAGFAPPGSGGRPESPEALAKLLFAHPERLVQSRSAEMLARNREAARHYYGGRGRDEALVTRLHDIRSLTLIVMGTKDGIIPAASANLLRERIPSSYLSYIYDAGHVLDVDQPARLAGLVTEFLTRAEAFIINWG